MTCGKALEISALAFGMIGTLVGLVNMLANMDDPKSIGPAMAVAILTTLYGAIIANLIAVPLKDKLATYSGAEIDQKTLMLEGVLSHQARGELNAGGVAAHLSYRESVRR